jgi:hypothetical protein
MRKSQWLSPNLRVRGPTSKEKERTLSMVAQGSSKDPGKVPYGAFLFFYP